MSAKSEKLGTYVVLLRAINVGGNNKLPMKDLVALMEKLGSVRPRHYIQSGNVVFQATPEVAAALPAKLAAALERGFKITVPIVMRTEAELRAAAAKNPLLAAGKDPETLHLMFLAHPPTPTSFAKLDPQKAEGGELALRGRDLYLHIPQGVAKWKLTNVYVDRTLETVSTMRNWRTVLRLLEMCGE